MALHQLNGKKTAVINIFIDPERGFLDFTLTEAQGGVLYVPGGEQVTPIMGKMIEKGRNTVFILGQDYHPANHISFMVNHPGVMEYRMEKFRKFLAANGQPDVDGEELKQRAQQPVHFFNGMENPPAAFPFEEIVLDEDRKIIGVKEEDGRIRKVELSSEATFQSSSKNSYRVKKVLDEYLPETFDDMRANGAELSTQTLWTKHCVQGTDSALYPADMKLPQGLQSKLNDDLMSPTVYHKDEATGNEYYVIRKGADSEVDSYGIGVENDGDSMTAAWDVFKQIARALKKQGCENVQINIGGLATNFCVEFSANNVVDFLAGHFKMRGMEVETNLVPEICRGIPIPGGAETPFSLDGTPERLAKSRHVGTATVEGILAITADAGKPQSSITRKFNP
jgi:nicotinamidase-related amidase